MANAVKKPIAVDFSDFSGGCVSEDVEHPSHLFGNQVTDESIGFTMRKSGLTKQPGASGLTSDTTFLDYLRGMFSHKTFSGTERLYGASDGKLYNVSTSDGSITEKFTIGSELNEVWACDSHGKKFLCNGNTVVKLEDDTAYQTGISAPSGASAAAASGTGLDDGDYSVYVGYARKVSGSNVLYSIGESLGTVSLSGGNNRISITFPNSSDSQVNNKVVWIKSTSSGELIHYFFYETDDNSTTSITISDASQKSTALVYEYAAAGNGLPPAVTFIFAFAGRLWGIIDNYIYYSNEGSYSMYDVERWPPGNYRITPYKLTGIFSVGLNLYFNTESGILLLPYGDINQKDILIEDRWHFYDMRTVDSWNNGVMGLTNQGVRFFNGEKFTDFDFGYPIRPKIDKIYSHDTNFKPCGFVYRRKFRDEYHLMWQDTSKSVNVNNTHAVLNLSSVIWQDFNNYNLAWEFYPISGSHAAVFKTNNNLYIGQSNQYASKVYTTPESTSQFNNVYDSSGTLLVSATDKQSYIKSRYHMEHVAGLMGFDKFYCHSKNTESFDIRICSGERDDRKTEWKTISASTGDPVTFPLTWPVTWETDSAQVTKKKMPSHFWTRSVYVEIRQTENDIKLNILQLTLFGELRITNYT